jgi:phosphoribosylformylglycinamidine cyclo-ligase
MESSKYSALGVDISKKGIEALKAIVDNLFPGSFCSIVRDPDFPDTGIVLHEDGVGTKSIVAYLYYKETGEKKWFETLATDVVAMNVDDVACVGGVPLVFSDYIAINPFKVNKEDLLSSLASGFSSVFSTLESLGFKVLFGGGETADLPDIVRTFDLSGSLVARVKLNDIVTGAEISPGDPIVGLRSSGKSKYEKYENSGIMCNGLTLARHCLLSKMYVEKYPEVSSPEVKDYFGRFKLDTSIPELGMSVGEALLSPTRIYLPIALEVLKKTRVKAMVHNTGGGLTKSLRIGNNIKYIKNNLPEPDPIFKLILSECKEEPREIYRSFNMGIGFEIIVEKGSEDEVLSISEKFGVEAQVIGYCEKSSIGNSVVIESKFGKFMYP